MQLKKPSSEWVLLAIILLGAAGLRLWRLSDNGFGTEYYAAAVRSMLQSGHLLFYGSFDPAGFVSIDKPPLAFWLQAVFAWPFGFNGFTIHLPQALIGVASVAMLYFLVKRYFGIAAGLIAAIVFALAPIAVAIDRSNNTDSLLIFLLLLSAGAALRGSGRALLVAIILLGLAFNVKMLAALVCGPAVLAGWLLATHLDWPRRLLWMAASGVALTVVALSWTVAFDLTPADARPYADSTVHNSMLELIVVHNGLQRFELDQPPPTANNVPRAELYDAVPVGPLRLANPNLAGQFAWLLPLAVVGAILAWRRQRAAIVLWSVWVLSYGIVYSAAGGIFHIYYLAALVPPLAALSGIGAVELWQRDRRWLVAALAITALWQAVILAGHLDWTTLWLIAPALALLLAVVALRSQWLAPALCSVALLVLPAAWAVSAIVAPGNLMLPSSSLARALGQQDGRGNLLSQNFRQPSDDQRFSDFLIAHRGAARFIVAAPSTRLVAPLIIKTGLPAMAIGGFTGNDPIVSLEEFKAMVGRGELRYVLLGVPRRNAAVIAAVIAAVSRNLEIFRWVRSTGKRVDAGLWSSQPDAVQKRLVLYDLRPD